MKNPELQLSELKAKLKTFFSEAKSLKDDQLPGHILQLETAIGKMDAPGAIPGEPQGYAARFIQNRREQVQASKGLPAAEKVQNLLDGASKWLKQKT